MPQTKSENTLKKTTRSFNHPPKNEVDSNKLTQSLVEVEYPDYISQIIDKKPSKFRFSEKNFVILLSLLIGLEDITSLSFFYY